MASLDTGARINGMDVAELHEFIASVETDRANADREAAITSRWIGGLRSAATSSFGGPTVFMGGDDDPGAMGMLLRALAACDIEVVVTKATLLGIRIEELTIEVTGDFNVAKYLGVSASEGSGYRKVSYVVHLRAPGATPEQITEIRRALEASPVADTLARSVPVNLALDVG
jgi:uncharacterized OsmC-like protein